MSLFVGCCVFVATLLGLAPCAYRTADRRMARQRRVGISPLRPPQHTDVGMTVPGDLAAWATTCEIVARALRAGETADVAVGRAMALQPDTPWQYVHAHLAVRRSIDEALSLSRDRTQGDEEWFLDLVRACVTGPGFDPEALDAVATVLRDRYVLRTEISTATSQARYTLRVLTALPLFAGGMTAVFSGTVRQLVFDGTLVPALTIGVFLNIAGRVWARRTVVRATRPAEDDRSSIAIDTAVVALRGGRHPGSVLAALREAPEPVDRAVLDLLTHALHDGVAVTDTAARLAADTRRDRRLHCDEAIRRLPVALSFPLVTCVLPSFLLLAVMPLVAAATTHLVPPT